ncbi:hypothetical protein FGO68_gene16671 [Halteria grandinella]|uniref:Uncharacterized protein n=1 Tax=Halteria grandinella TaxID=5974 RepID=A0A8J8N9X9_HALGN|nr:hypothetical protein FGO68_gene16671 [Halteria grandinella]
MSLFNIQAKNLVNNRNQYSLFQTACHKGCLIPSLTNSKLSSRVIYINFNLTIIHLNIILYNQYILN